MHQNDLRLDILNEAFPALSILEHPALAPVGRVFVFLFLLGIFLDHEGFQSGLELGRRSDKLSLVQMRHKAHMYRSALDRHHMISGDNSHIGTHLELFKCITDALAHRIFQANRRNQSQVVFNDCSRIFAFEVILAVFGRDEFIGVKIAIRDRNRLKARRLPTPNMLLSSIEQLGVILHHHTAIVKHLRRRVGPNDQLVDHDILQVICAILPPSIERVHLIQTVQLACTQRYDRFWRPFDNQSHDIRVVFERVRHSHSFSLRAKRDPKLESVVALTLYQFILDRDA